MHSESSTSYLDDHEEEGMWKTDSAFLKENRTGRLLDWINNSSSLFHLQNVASVQERNATETDPGSLPRSVADQLQFHSVKRYLTAFLMVELYSISSRGIRSCTSSSSDEIKQAPRTRESGSRSFQAPRHRASTKRRKTPTDDGEDEQRREQKKPANGPSHVGNFPRFACPYYQNDPSQYSPIARGPTFRPCAGPGFTTIGRMK